MAAMQTRASLPRESKTGSCQSQT
uniref:Uncharacterized protein n=1 Tax=Rhizophora mucronata TaxID=61149 RepID=A0A2P2IJ38_RHIMU